MKPLLTVLVAAIFIGGDGKDSARRLDFEDAAIGSVPKGWTSAKTGTGEGSVWKVLEDRTAPRGAKVIAQMAEGPGPLFNLCVLEAAAFHDVEISVAFKAIKGQTDQGGGVVWRYVDANNYYITRMNPLEGNFRVYKVVEGKRTQLATAEADGAAGKWHELRVIHKGEHIRCYFNGKLHLDVEDATFKQAGKIGLWTKADAVTYFDDLRIGKAGE